jgi:hypothetical protein
VVRGRGAAAALGAALAFDPPATALVLPAVIGGPLVKRSALGVMVAALALPLASVALGHRRKAVWCAAFPVVLAYARLRGSDGAPAPTSRELCWERFWFDRDPVGAAPGGAPRDSGGAPVDAAQDGAAGSV